MSKSLFIAEKPSVAQQFADALKIKGRRGDGFLESENTVITWCVGHLVTMSYPEAYNPALKRWSLSTLPFLPKEFKYQVIDSVAKQYKIVAGLLTRPDVETIYVCTDSGREGEYIYRLVAQMAGVKGKVQKRVWIDSQTEEEILRGIREAKDLSAYDNLGASAYLRAKEDYLMGINFSRVLTLKYGPVLSAYLKTKSTVISAGRVMTCVLGMAVRREREIRQFVKTPFYRVVASFKLGEFIFTGEWKAVPGSRYFGTPALYKENGFKEKRQAQELIDFLQAQKPQEALLVKKETKKETKNPPLLYNLAELQNDCSKLFKISPDQTLQVVQELYEKKLVTYPRTDARVLSTAVAKEIGRNIGGLKAYSPIASLAQEVLAADSWKTIAKSRYVNDKQITDHYAIIPTGQGLGALSGVKPLGQKVYQLICRRFLSIFYPPARYAKHTLELEREKEHFFASFKVLTEPGYLKATDINYGKKEEHSSEAAEEEQKESQDKDGDQENRKDVENPAFLALLKNLKKGQVLPIEGISIKLYTKEGEEQPAGGIRYRAHVQNIGWMDWVSDDDYAGTKGQSLRMEAVQIELTGEIKEQYDVYYTTYVQNIGWLGWAKNGQSSGTEAFSRQVEAIRIFLVEKGSEAPGENQGYFVKGLPSSALSATAHIQIYGDRTTTGSGKLIGTTGEKKRMEGLRLTIKGAGESGCPSGGIRYRAHVQNIGWQGWKQNGELAGTKGKSLRIEAIQIELTGELARYYDVYYSAHVQQLG